MPILRGTQLLSAVQQTKHDIRVRTIKNPKVQLVLHPPNALQLVRFGNWEGRLRGKRVHWLREIEPAVSARDDTYRYERPLFRFHGSPDDVSCYEDLARDSGLSQKIEGLRVQEYSRAIAALPSGKWMEL